MLWQDGLRLHPQDGHHQITIFSTIQHLEHFQAWQETEILYGDFTHKYKIFQGVMVGWSQSLGRSPTNYTTISTIQLLESFLALLDLNFFGSNLFQTLNFLDLDFFGPQIILGLKSFSDLEIIWQNKTNVFSKLNTLDPSLVICLISIVNSAQQHLKSKLSL